MTITPPTAQPPPWGVWATLAWLVLAFVVSALAAVGCYSFLLVGQPRPDPDTYNGVLISVGAMVSIPVQSLVLTFAARLRRWPAVDYLALYWPRRGEVIVAVVAVIALDAVFNALLYATGHDLVTPFQVEAYRTAKEAGWLFWLFVAIVIFAPIGEEIAFRGFLYRGLAQPGREPYAIVAIAIVWALLHVQYDWTGIAQVFAIGLMLGWFRWASGSTALTILMHVLINFEAMIETTIKVEVLS